MPVDTYTGGIEHATMHLIYTRFFHKALRDMGITKGTSRCCNCATRAIVLGEDGEKMSKSRGNVVPPDAAGGEVRRRHGAGVPDVLRPLGSGRPVEQPGDRRLRPLAAPGVDSFHRAGGICR